MDLKILDDEFIWQFVNNGENSFMLEACQSSGWRYTELVDTREMFKDVCMFM